MAAHSSKGVTEQSQVKIQKWEQYLKKCGKGSDDGENEVGEEEKHYSC